MCVSFLKCVGLSVLEPACWEGSPRGSCGEAINAIVPILQVQAPHLSYVPSCDFFSPRNSVVSLKRTRKKITCSPMPHRKKSVMGTRRFSRDPN